MQPIRENGVRTLYKLIAVNRKEVITYGNVIITGMPGFEPEILAPIVVS